MVNPTRCFGAILISDIYTILEQNRARCLFQRYQTVSAPYPIMFLQSEVTYTLLARNPGCSRTPRRIYHMCQLCGSNFPGFSLAGS